MNLDLVMGRIQKVLPTETIVKEVVQTFMKDSTTQYPSFLETAPTFINYYSRNAYTSTHDVSFENFNEIAGEESPNKFHKIENLPIYSLDTSEFGSNLDDAGWSGDINSSGIILPDTITPKPDDLLEIVINSKKYLFQVTNGTADNFNNNKFYKISFKLSQYTKTEVEQATTETFKVDYSLIGKQKNTLIKKSYVEFLEDLKYKYDELLSAYKESYFNVTLGTFVLEDTRILDQFLNYFIIENNLAKSFVQYRNSIAISPTLHKYVDRRKYSDSFFSLIKANDYPKLKDTKLSLLADLVTGNKHYEIFYFLKNKANFVIYQNYIQNSTILDLDYSFLSLPTFSSDDANLNFIYKYSKIFMKLNELGQLQDGLVEVDSTTNVEVKEFFEDILSDINSLQPVYSRFPEDVMGNYVCNYYSTPIVLFALKELYAIIVKA
jgi:hypothetical protein